MKIEGTDHWYSRRDFLSVAAAVPILISAVGAPAAVGDRMSITGPDGQVRFFLDSPFSYRVTLKDRLVIATSRMGIVIDGVDLGAGASIKKIEAYNGNTRYDWRGVHSQATDHFRGARIHAASKIDFTVDVRVFRDGVGFRYIIPGNGSARIPDEATSFSLPKDSISWFHDFYGHYEGTHQRKKLSDVKDGEWAAPPVTFELPGVGYAAVTEAALIDYPGMGLRADGNNSFRAVLGHALPVSHPYELRYSKDDITRLSKPTSITGDIITPWRVVLVSPDLNGLVNSDIIHNLSPPPDQKLFPDGFATSWLRPGRAVWRYLDGGENTLDGMKEFSRLASELGFEHNIVEGFWRRWTEDQMRELVDYSSKLKVGVWFWEHSRNLKTDDTRRAFFERLNRVGVVGAKIDFFDHEAKEVIDQYHALLRSAAEHKIMLEFHGSNKPTGESRTWPNEVTRESVRGMEYRSMTERAVHNTTLPFTRFLAGHADYTPVHFGERRRETSWAHQLATAAVFTSPLMIYGSHPKTILENPAVDMVKSIPSTWDETVVLQPSRIGEIGVFARRKGKTWFLAILNGSSAKAIKLRLPFLGRGQYKSMIVRDNLNDPASVDIETPYLDRDHTLNIEMRAGGGFIARFVPTAHVGVNKS
jgi:alpha-glucosidase